jgi:hypothetical protein
MTRAHPSIPFLTAAIAALLLYRGMISIAGLDNTVIFTTSLSAAAVLAGACLMAHLLFPARNG